VDVYKPLQVGTSKKKQGKAPRAAGRSQRASLVAGPYTRPLFSST